jgi:Protein of unknown function (DUF1192).
MTEDDEAIRRKPAYVVGARLDDLSVAECDERIAELKIEIERLEQARRAKQAALVDAGSFFKR